MRTACTHLWKEWREQRWILLAILVAISLLTAVGGWALGFGAVDYGRFAPVHVAGSTALVVLALSTELFAAEGRRDGFAFLRRTPGALRVAWGAKAAFYLLACAAVVAWSAAVLAGTATLLRGDVAREEVLFALGSPLMPALVGLVVTVGLWILLASVWIPRGAAAAGVALLLLALLAGPAWWLLRENPLFRVPASWAWAVAAAAVGLPLVGIAAGLVRGLRVARPTWSAAWRGLLLVGVVSAPAYAAGLVRLERWRDLRPDEDGVVLEAYVGTGGRHAWVTAYRFQGEEPSQGVRRAFHVDLASGRARPLGPLGSLVYPQNDVVLAHGWACLHGLVQVYSPSLDERSVAWWDGAEGTWLKTLPADVSTPDLLERRRAELRRSTPVRLPDGRPVWILERRVEHDEPDGTVASVPLPNSISGSQALPCGAWSGYDRDANCMVCIAPTGDGGVRTVPWEVAGRPGAWNRLTPERYLSSVGVAKGKPAPQGGRWRLVDTVTGSDAPARGFGDRDTLLAILAPDRALVVRTPAGTHSSVELRVVSPESGESVRIAPPPEAPASLTEYRAQGRRPDGVLVISAAGRSPDPRRGYLLLDPDAAALRSWTPSPHAQPWGEVLRGCPDDDTAIVLEAGRRLIRIRWGSAEREVVFPR